MASDPPTLISENNAAKFFGVQRPHPFSLLKKRNEIFWIGNDPPPIRKFSENSSNLVQVVTPKLLIYNDDDDVYLSTRKKIMNHNFNDDFRWETGAKTSALGSVLQ